LEIKKLQLEFKPRTKESFRPVQSQPDLANANAAAQPEFPQMLSPPKVEP
jgi:hypothetical protein